MRFYGSRWRTTLWLVAGFLSLVLGGLGSAAYATGNQDGSFVIAQNTGKGVKKTLVAQLTKKDLRRTNDEGPVEMAVSYLNPLRQKAGPELSFEVRMNTHSVELDAYEMEKISFLRIDGGDEQKALSWSKPGGGGHHRSGVLRFAGPLPSGAQSLQVIIRGIGGVQERVFEWKLPLEAR
ncbi:MAG: hypothetical protein GTO13_04335 [Proteobacteria bacterium]|nr:hypothetical protein [Pseudomonadota bacterium]